jgi:predicted MFS family arabinose efflux permease
VLNIAIYPTGAYTTATLVAAAQTANATGGLNIGIPTANVAGSATFTNV